MRSSFGTWETVGKSQSLVFRLTVRSSSSPTNHSLTRAPADAGYTTVRIEYSLTTRSRCTGERTRLELSSEVQLKNMSTQCLGQIRSNECSRVLCGTRLAICG